MSSYVSYDEYGADKLQREMDSAYVAGAQGEKVPHVFTSGKERHEENVKVLKGTLRQFSGEDFKRRLHGKVADRLEQEIKWLAHYDRCIAEHKKGTGVDKLNKEILALRKKHVESQKALRIENEKRIDEVRKEHYKSMQERFARKWDVKWKRKGFFGRLGYILGGGTKLSKKKGNKSGGGSAPKFYQFHENKER